MLQNFMKTLPLALLIPFLALSFVFGQEAAPVTDAPPSPVTLKPAVEPLLYDVDLRNARNHYVYVRLETPVDQEVTELMMAVWTPGSYLVREYARHVDQIEAKSADGESLKIEKVRKNRWRIDTSGTDRMVVKYRLYCRELSVRTNFVNYEYAVLNGAPTFMTLVGQLQRPHHIALKLPDGWSRSATALQDDPDLAHAYRARNFDEVVDSPIVAGNVIQYPFEVNGVLHFLVNVGEQGIWDGASAVKDLATMVKAHHEIWGTIPYDRYLFINVIGGGGGGLEHDNCCLMMTGRWTSREPSRYNRWLTLASHEFFHTWNIRRLRPRPLINYDYENEVYVRTLWVGEGVTSYYENLAMVRAGLISERDFLSRLSRDIQSVQNTPGRKRQSLRESSYDSWIKFYRPDDNASNTRISYYSKGAVVAFLLDAEIRSATGGEKSLDDVLRLMFERYRETGYTPDDFRAAASEIAGRDLSEFFARSVDSTDELDYGTALDWFGLEFVGRPRPDPESNGSASDELSEPEDGRPWLGIRTRNNEVTGVTANSPATEYGINLDDEIIGINGWRVTSSVDSWIRRFKVGDEIELLVSRGGKLMTMRVRLAAQPNTTWRLATVGDPSEEEQQRRDDWLSASE